MTGVKGRSGGPRKNAGGPRKNAGGYRAGAGRKPNPPLLVRSRSLQKIDDPGEWLLAAMNDESVPMKERLEVAAAIRKFNILGELYNSAMRGSVTAQIVYLRAAGHFKRKGRGPVEPQ